MNELSITREPLNKVANMLVILIPIIHLTPHIINTALLIIMNYIVKDILLKQPLRIIDIQCTKEIEKDRNDITQQGQAAKSLLEDIWESDEHERRSSIGTDSGREYRREDDDASHDCYNGVNNADFNGS